MINLNELRDRVHAANDKWWTDLQTGERIKRNQYELLALVLSEVSEALEGARKDLMDDHLPHRKMEEVECADIVIRLADYAGGFECNLMPMPGWWRYQIRTNKGEFFFLVSQCVCEIPENPNRISQVIWALHSYANHHGFDLWGAVEEKLLYNRHRMDHSHAARLAEGGKKF